MGLVTETLIALLYEQVKTHGTLVWYDPEGAYTDLAATLTSEQVCGADIFHYQADQGFLWLRHELESLWSAAKDEAPRLLIYVPLDRQETGNALFEFEVGGVVLQPGQQPPARNTALAAVAREALSSVMPPALVAETVAQVEAGQLSLPELDRLAEKGAETGVISVIFGTGDPIEVALRFLAEPAVDKELKKRKALDDLAGFLADAMGVPFGSSMGADELRAILARQVLFTDFITGRADATPASLLTFQLAEHQVAVDTACELARIWRNRRDAAASYVAWSERLQSELGLGSIDLPLWDLAGTETFISGEFRLQKDVEQALAKQPSTDLVGLVELRLDNFWSTQKPEIKTRWEVILDAGRLMLKAQQIHTALKNKGWTGESLIREYSYGDNPWCELDMYHRHLERDFHRFEFDPQAHEGLQQLVSHARSAYTAAANELAERFIDAYATQKFDIPLLPQTDIFSEAVYPHLGQERVAYLLVDAFRYEMAYELLSHIRELQEEWDYTLDPSLATPPTITDVGMAALMPGAENGIMIISLEGKAVPEIAGRKLKTRQDRIDLFKSAVGQEAVEAKLHDIAPLSNVKLRKALEIAQVVLITATEDIDGLAENNPALARRMLDEVLNQIRRGVKTLFSLGFHRVVISADHGYLFGEAITVSDTIPNPGGQKAILKRRVWLGQGGAEQPQVLRVPLSAFGIGSDLEMAIPRNLSCFAVPGGSTEYFHGGLSLQELVIPVMAVSSAVKAVPAGELAVEWALTLGSKAITTRFLSVTVEGSAQQLWGIEPISVRIEVRIGDTALSIPVSAAYGFKEASKEVEMQPEIEDNSRYAPNTITLQITEDITAKKVTIHLLDATTGISLARLDGIPVSISL